MSQIVHKVGLEFEVPVVKPDFTAIDFDDLDKLLNIFVQRDWKPKHDPYTHALVGVTRTSVKGTEEVGTDFGICSLEVALAPTATPEESEAYWRAFKQQELLPAIHEAGLMLLGYGTQPISGNMKNLVGKKGHYLIWPNLISDDTREWVLENWPGLSAAQYNFEVDKTEVLKVVNTVLKLDSLLWAAGANSPIAGGKELPYRCQRYHGYHIMAKDRLYDRWGPAPKLYTSLCDYINRCWSVPIFEILREGKSYYSDDPKLTTWQFINKQTDTFLDLDRKESSHTLELADLKYAIYFAWPDCRIKFNFKDITAEQLIETVKQGHDQQLLELIEFTLIEIRPLAMQNQGQEVEWMYWLWQLLSNIGVAQEYTKDWDYQETIDVGVAAQEQGMKTIYRGVTLGQHTVNLTNHLLDIAGPGYKLKIQNLYQLFSNDKAPADEILEIYRSHGQQAMLEQMVIKN